MCKSYLTQILEFTNYLKPARSCEGLSHSFKRNKLKTVEENSVMLKEPWV